MSESPDPRTLGWLSDAVWRQLDRGVADGQAPARHLALATVGSAGAEIRTVVLRSADRGAATLDVHTDAATPKVAQLRADPRASLMFWDPAENLQVRLRVRVSVIVGPEAEATWREVPEAARANYGSEPAPGTPIAHPDGYRAGVTQDRFAILRAAIAEIDAVHLGRTPHRRALFAAGDGFAGCWLAP